MSEKTGRIKEGTHKDIQDVMKGSRIVYVMTQFDEWLEIQKNRAMQFMQGKSYFYKLTERGQLFLAKYEIITKDDEASDPIVANEKMN